MSIWKISGFKITEYKVDHPPHRVHIRKDGKLVGKYDLENNQWMEGPYHAADQANKAIRQWRIQQGI